MSQTGGPRRGGTPAPPAARPVEAPAAEPGDFTRMFQTQGAPAAAPPAGPAAKATSQPGEFTQLFQSPPPPAPEPPRASQPGAGPGDFTRLFNSSMPHAPAQGDLAPAPPKTHEPADFTRT